MNFKRYNESDNSWTDSHYIKKTDTDIITALPATIYPLAQTATLGLKGNTVQNGTPTSDNPIMPQGCGDLETVGAKAGQFKIPISCGGTTTPVYLGEVESTRRIKKLVLTGEETIRLQSINEYNIANFYINIVSVAKDGLSSHFEKQNTTIGQTQTEGFLLAVSGGSTSTTLYMRTSTSRASTTTEMQTWLSNQYTNGTPVTFWYTTEDTTTGIVNEPIRKIGEYADTVSGITIPTIAGADSFDVLTTLKPSEVTVNYKGWHPVTDVHERESGAWT